jgi:hypothetical protein
VLTRLAPSLKASISKFEGLGHLSHEEQPARTTELLIELYHRRLNIS